MVSRHSRGLSFAPVTTARMTCDFRHHAAGLGRRLHLPYFALDRASGACEGAPVAVGDVDVETYKSCIS